MSDDLQKVSGLWANDTKTGGKYLGGRIAMESLLELVGTLEASGADSVKILVFKNSYKENDSQPDFNMNFAPIDPKPVTQQQADHTKSRTASPKNVSGRKNRAQPEEDFGF